MITRDFARAEAARSSRVRKPAMLLSASAAMLAIALSQPAFAQDAPPAPEPVATPNPANSESAPPAVGGQDIVVTGSRIVRRDYNATSPIVTVDRALLDQASTSSIETNLNKLPQFSAANLKTPTTGGGDIQPTARNTPGAASVSLRGLGSNRTLVLINGRRATPSNALGTVDINTIPSAAIERVEVITGGASSTYGADAVAGVTNFILKQNFTGLELDGQMSLTERGDGREFTLAGIMGTNFADDRGNISVSFSMNQREAAYNRNRSWYTDLWANPNIPGTGFFPGGYGGVSFGFGNLPSQAVINSLFPQAAAGSVPTAGLYLFANPGSGTVFSGFSNAGATGAAGSYRATGVDGYRIKRLANGQLAPNFVDALTVFPATRYNMFVNGKYDVSDDISVFVQGNFANTTTSSTQEGAPVVNGWSATVPYNSANPQADIPLELRRALNSRPDPNAPFTIYQLLPFNRDSSGDVYSYNMTAGLQGKIPNTDWTWEIFASHGKTASSVKQEGFGSLQRYRTIIASPNFGAGFRATGNPEGGGFGASTATCTTGFNPFSQTPVSDDCFEAIRADIKTKSTLRQTIYEANFQGGLFDLPAGSVRAAVGASYRNNNYVFDNDTLTTQGRSFIEQAIGLYPAGNSEGTIVAKELYGELLIPILSDTPFFEELNLEVGGRMSKYNTTGTSYTYKVLGDWKVANWLRFRGGYNRAERTPNIAELFLAPEQTFAVSAGGDVCSRLNGQTYSANPARNPTNAAGVETLCRALMARSGNPNAATQYYSNPQVQGFSFVFPTLTGNPNLSPEKADTWTAGVVISSPFQSDFLNRLRLSVDYYNIKVSDAIGNQSVDIAQRQCFDTAFNPTLSAASPFCAGINRNQDGGLGNVITTFFNNGRFRTSGIDAQLDWSFPAGPGNVNLNVVGNYLLDMKSAELAVLPLIEYAGSIGPTNNGLDGGAYRWKLFSTVGYSIGANSISLQWRHLPSVDLEAKALNPASTQTGYPSYDVFNLFGTVGVTRDIVFRFGVENLFDKAPPLGAVETAPGPGVLSGGQYNAQFYDIIGRRYYVGAKAKF